MKGAFHSKALLRLGIFSIVVLQVASGSTCTAACNNHIDWFCKITFTGHKAECSECQTVCQSESDGDRQDCNDFCQNSQFYHTTPRACFEVLIFMMAAMFLVLCAVKGLCAFFVSQTAVRFQPVITQPTDSGQEGDGTARMALGTDPAEKLATEC